MKGTTVLFFTATGYNLWTILRSGKYSHRQIPIPDEALFAPITLIDVRGAANVVVDSAGWRTGRGMIMTAEAGTQVSSLGNEGDQTVR